MTLDEIIDDFVEEATYHEADLWEIANTARDDLGAGTPEKMLETSLEICRRLYERGVRPVDWITGSEYEFWSDEGCEAMLARIRREWIALGHEPVIFCDIGSFIMPGPRPPRPPRNSRPTKD